GSDVVRFAESVVDVRRLDADTAAVCDTLFRFRRQFAVAVVRHHKDGLAFHQHIKTDEFIIFTESDPLDTGGCPSHRADLLLRETDEGTVFGAEDDFFRAVCQTYCQKFVVSLYGYVNLAIFGNLL